jgi:hypothetical protein
MTRWLRILLMAVLLAVSATATSPALAGDAPKPEDVNEARSRYKKGLDLYEDGAFDAALIEFQRAYDTAPSYKILYNIGLVYLQLNDYAGALRTFKKYVDDGGKKIDTKRRAEVDREIKKLEGRVASLTIKVNVEGAEVSIDDLEVGETPIDYAVFVNAGKRKVSAAKSGYAPATRVVVLAGGDEKTIELELRPGSAGPQPLQTKPAAPLEKPKHEKPVKEATPGRSVPWLLWGVTGALAIGATTAGVLTLQSQNDFNNKKDHPASKDVLDKASKKTRTLAIVTDVLIGGTVVVGGYATYLTFFEPQKEPAADSTALQFRVGPGRVEVGGRF